MSTTRLVFLIVPAACRVLLAGFLDMLAALLFLAYRLRWLIAAVAAAVFGALWAACVGEVR